MNWRPLASLLGVAALALGACQQSNPATTSGGKPLIAEPTTGVTFSEDFNPYDSNSVTSAMGTRSLVNEPLVEFDQLDPTPAGGWVAAPRACKPSVAPSAIAATTVRSPLRRMTDLPLRAAQSGEGHLLLSYVHAAAEARVGV